MIRAVTQIRPSPWHALLERQKLALSLILVSLTLAVYFQVYRFDFVIVDDGIYVGDNEFVRSGLSRSGIQWAFLTLRDGNWFPLTWLSLMLDATLYGTWPGGYHITNLLLHIANVLLVFHVLAAMTEHVPRSAFVGALFAVHPLHVQSVAWIAERKDVLSMFFGLLSLYAYVRYSQDRRIGRLALCGAFFLCSLLSKQTFVTLSFVFLLLDYWPLRRLARAADLVPLVREKLPFCAASAVLCAVAARAQSHSGYVLSLETIPLTSRLLNAIVVYRLYLQKAFFPVGLAAYYPHPGPRLGLTNPILSFVFLSAITVFAAWQARRRPYLIVGWLWYLGTLVPMIGLVQLSGQQMADRYTYFPLLGIYAAVAWLVPSLLPARAGRPRVLPTLAAAIVGIYAAVAFVQVGYWHDGVTLFRHAVEVGEENPYSLTILGWALVNERRYPESLPYLRRAVDLAPQFAQSQFLLGCVLQKANQLDAAAEHFRAAIASEPENAAAHLNLGIIDLARRRFADAQREFDRVLELDKENPRVQVYLADLCLQLHKYPESIAHAKRALELEPNQPQCQLFIALALRDQGRFDEAIAQFHKMLVASPQNAGLRREIDRLAALKNGRRRSAVP